MDKVIKFELSKNKTELKSFIHLCRFYMQHVQSFAEIIFPRTNLLKKDDKFILDPKKIIAWNLLKAQTLKTSQLAFLNPTFQDKIYTEASYISIRSVYIQINEKEDKGQLSLLAER